VTIKELIERLQKFDPSCEVDLEIIGDVGDGALTTDGRSSYIGEARSVYQDLNDDTVIISQELR
jgi:hypothetical protein